MYQMIVSLYVYFDADPNLMQISFSTIKITKPALERDVLYKLSECFLVLCGSWTKI